MPTKTEEKSEKREKTEEREKQHELAKRSAMGRGPLSDEERECRDREAAEERERWQKPPEPLYSEENLALLKEFAKKAIEIRKLLADRKFGTSLPIPSRFVSVLTGAITMVRGLGVEGLEETVQPIPREGHIAHSTDPPMSLAYAPPGVNPTPWVPQEPLDRLGLGPDARLITEDTVEPADGGETPPAGNATVTLSPTSAPAGAGGFVLAVTGTGTNFVDGQTAVSISGSDVTFGAVAVSSPTSLEVPTTVQAGAATGDRTVTVTTGSETATATFSIT